MSTCMDTSHNISYMALGLMGEVGEFMSKIAKGIRKNEYYIGQRIEGNLMYPSDNDLHINRLKIKTAEAEEKDDALKAELGDILWFCAGIAEVMGWSLEEVAQGNVDKLADRQQRGVINGDGDKR